MYTVSRRLFGSSLGLSALLLSGCAGTAPETPSSSTGPPDVHAEAPVAQAGTPSVTAQRAQDTWIAGQFMVRATAGTSIDDPLSTLPVTLERRPGLSGYALISVAGSHQRAVLAKLLADPRIDSVYPNARTTGAAIGSARHRTVQWHLDAIGEPAYHTGDFSGIVVAVLDTGAATDNTFHDGLLHKEAGSLEDVPLTDGYDFINDDTRALDDHQHGTHIATTLLGDGAIMGTAPGATLMPIKVLDDQNSGTEWALVEGIYFAVLHGADVANMSLSFSPDYLPSGALVEALTVAADADMVLLGASGNHLSDQAAWPAAHPGVIAVGASTLISAGTSGPAWYGNLGTAVDVLAPGGDTSVDNDGDGYNDGILAQAIRLNNPLYTPYYFMAGTSQATAVASGLAVQLLADGVAPADIQRHLQAGAVASAGSFGRGEGAGDLSASGALSVTTPSGPASAHVGMLPYLLTSGTDVIPMLDLAVLDEAGLPLANADVQVTALGNVSQSWLQCTTDATGHCSVASDPVDDATEVAVMFRADAVVIDDTWTVHPAPMLYESAVFDDLIAAMDADPALSALPLAVSWTAGTDPELGDIAEGYSVVDTGSGLASLPIGLVFNRTRMLTLPRTTHTVTLQSLSISVQSVEIGGSGLASLPIGLRFASFGFISGSGLASLPIGLHPKRIFVSHSTGRPVWLDRPLGSYAPTPGTALEARISAGGWTARGYPAASYATAASGVTVAASVSTGNNRAAEEMYDPLEPSE